MKGTGTLKAAFQWTREYVDRLADAASSALEPPRTWVSGPDGTVWSFAYGSNLHPDKLQARANVRPAEAVPGVLHGWRLTFDLTGLPGVEPSMASITPDPKDEVHGVLLRLTEAQLQALVESEGGNLFYDLVQVTVDAYDGRCIDAYAFRARSGMTRPEVPPSQRYLDLIRAGARHHGLDPDWLRRLESLPHAGPPSELGRRVWRFFELLDRPENRRWRGPVLAVVARLLLLEGRLRQLGRQG